MRVTANRAAVCCAVFAIAVVAAPSLAGAKLKKERVQTAVTLSVIEDQTDPSGKSHEFSGSLSVDPAKRKTCLKRELVLSEDGEPVATAESGADGNFDFGVVKTKKDRVYQAEALRKTKRKKGKKIVCKPGLSNQEIPRT